MDFEIRKNKKHAKFKKFVKEMKMYKKTKIVLTRLQEKVRKYTNRNRKKIVKYKVRDKVLLNMKDLT